VIHGRTTLNKGARSEPYHNIHKILQLVYYIRILYFTFYSDTHEMEHWFDYAGVL